MKLSNKYLYENIEKMISERFTLKLFYEAKEEYLNIQTKDKTIQIEDIVFCINNNINIKKDHKKYKELDYKEIKILLNKIIGIIHI